MVIKCLNLNANLTTEVNENTKICTLKFVIIK